VIGDWSDRMFRDGFETERSGDMTNREVLGRLRPLFRPYGWHFGGALVLLLTASALVIAGPILIKRAIDVNIAGGDTSGLRVTVMLYLAAQLAHLGITYAMRNWLEWAGQSMMARIKKKLFAHLLRLPMSFYDGQPPGRLLSRVENDTQALRMLFTTTSVMLLGDLFLFVGMYVAMAMVSVRLTLVTAIILPCLLGVTIFFQKRTYPIFIEVRKLTAEICARLTEFIQGMPVLRAFERRHWAAGNFQRLNREKFRVEFRGERLIVLWFNVIFFLEAVAFALILGIGGMWALSGLVTIGTLAMFIGYVRRFFDPLFRLSEQLAVIQKAIAAAERIFLLLKEPLTIDDPERPLDWPGLANEVRFENVWFRYRDDGEWVLQDVSLRIPAGSRCALVGPTGGGKTTVVSLLLRFYEVTRGRILIDGVDIRSMRQAELRRKIGLVLQDIYLFPGNLEANLTLGRDVTRERVEAAAGLTLSNRVVARLPDGYASDLSERGANVSVGERQLLSFTRAIVHDPALLILDEATSAVDPATEATIGRAMERTFEGRTALIIAHRLSTIRRCDTIFVVHHGRIVERGSHEELLDMGGLYRSLHDLQLTEGSYAAHEPS